jgi:hypothetical protein
MLDEEFKTQRARTVRELAEKANDPFIKRRLQDLAARYEDDPKPRTTLTTIDLIGTPGDRSAAWDIGGSQVPERKEARSEARGLPRVPGR